MAGLFISRFFRPILDPQARWGFSWDVSSRFPNRTGYDAETLKTSKNLLNPVGMVSL